MWHGYGPPNALYALWRIKWCRRQPISVLIKFWNVGPIETPLAVRQSSCEQSSKTVMISPGISGSPYETWGFIAMPFPRIQSRRGRRESLVWPTSRPSLESYLDEEVVIPICILPLVRSVPPTRIPPSTPSTAKILLNVHDGSTPKFNICGVRSNNTK
jgi:hypothetical protein